MRLAILFAGGAVVALLVFLYVTERDSGRATPDRPVLEEQERTRKTDAPSEPDATPEPLTVRVIDAKTKAPIAGARVRAFAAVEVPSGAMLEDYPESVAEAVTDAEGRAVLADGKVFVASAPGYASGRGGAEIELERAQAYRVRVVDAEQRAIPTAVGVVFRRNVKWPRMVVRADRDGILVVRTVGWDRLLVRAPGYATARIKSRRETVVLKPEFRIKGIVVDEAGAPVPGALIEIEPPFRPHEFGTTDANGRFDWGGLDEHGCRVRVKHDDFLTANVHAESGDDDIRVVMYRPRDLAGVVVFPDGSPAAGASVVAYTSRTTTDEQGRFRLAGLGAQPVILLATLGNLPALRMAVGPPAHYGTVQAQPPATDVRVVLERRYRSFARFRFVDAAGQPADVWSVGGQAYTENNEMTVAFPVAPRAEHPVRFSRGRRVFIVRTRTYAGAAPVVAVVAPEAPRATLIVRLPDGSPLPKTLHADIDVESYVTWRVKGTRRHDRVTIEFNDLREMREFPVRVSAPGYARVSKRLPIPEPAGTIEVRLRNGATVRGIALRPDGRPLREGWVNVWVRGLAPVRSGVFEASGGFRVENVPAGDAVITLGLEEVALARLERRIEEGAEIDLGTIRLESMRDLRGRAVDAAGQPLASVKLNVGNVVDGVSRADGSFHLRVPPQERGVVIASKPGYGTVGVPQDKAGEIRLHKGGRIRLTLRRADPPDERVKSWSINARIPGADWDWQPQYDAIERKRGFWVREYYDLPPGPVEIFVATMIGQRSVRVQVRPGKTAAAELTVP